jgi:formate C-acetyltransferase
VTALLNSVSKIDFSTCAAGTLNIRMPKNLVAGDDGLDRLMILLETYFENGGMQAQLSIADTAELRDAQAHPENYPDLMVRVTGYSAVFVDMCRKAQDDIICRDEVS